MNQEQPRETVEIIVRQQEVNREEEYAELVGRLERDVQAFRLSHASDAEGVVSVDLVVPSPEAGTVRIESAGDGQVTVMLDDPEAETSSQRVDFENGTIMVRRGDEAAVEAAPDLEGVRLAQFLFSTLQLAAFNQERQE